jgi:hypothetical protein
LLFRGEFDQHVLDVPKPRGFLQEKISAGWIVTKKGTLIQPRHNDVAWQQRAFSAYEQINAYFMQTFDYELWLAFGTLLGMYRDGQFIPHDDDFDTAYLSKETTPEGVRDERFAIARRMAEDGWELSISRSGLIKPKHQGTKLLDIHPAWLQHGYLWLPNVFQLRMAKDDVLPLVQSRFMGYCVNVPRSPEQFLSEQYGCNWQVPDIGYRPATPHEARAFISAALPSREEFARFGGR